MADNLLDLDFVQASRSIYRIMSFTRLIELFRIESYPFVRPEKWDDPFETYLSGATYLHRGRSITLPLRQIVYGSCWTKKSTSDAMWRIYSPDKLAVRIKTTPNILATNLDEALGKRTRAKWFIGRVQYLRERDILNRAESTARDILQDKTDIAAARSYLFKRNAFSHEDEVRILLIDRNARPKDGVLMLPLNPHRVIQSVLVDPRAPDAVVHMYRSYLKSEFGFAQRVQQSRIYTPPKPLVIDLDRAK
jgi:hypothetical protein